MVEFSFEVPHAHLEDFASYQDFFFLLGAHLEHKEYYDFHKNQYALGVKQLWLDNNYNELGEADNICTLAERAHHIRASKVIIPDDPTWTEEQMWTSYCEACFRIAREEIVVVVNNEKMFKSFKERGVTKFALSYHIRLPHYEAGGKPEDFLWAKDCHFLGLCSVEELRIINPPTCDTSMPIKLALQNKSLYTWMKEACPHIHTKDILSTFFDTKMTTEQLALAKLNINLLKNLVNGGHYNAKNMG